jgi:hypothetical protein
MCPFVTTVAITPEALYAGDVMVMCGGPGLVCQAHVCLYRFKPACTQQGPMMIFPLVMCAMYYC